MSDEALARAARLVAACRDVIDERTTGPAPPSWSDARGYTAFVEALDDDGVTRAERDGLGAVVRAREDAPRGLRALVDEIDEVCALEAPPRVVARELRGASARKAAQIAALLPLVDGLGARSRIVDVGAGHGHLTRALAEATGLPTLGWEREPRRVAAARARAGDQGPTFVEGDVEALAHELRAGDLVVGLHACGALGELAFEAAGRAGAAVLWVGCCLQKRPGARAPMSPVDGVPEEALTLSRGVLGLANVRRGEDGIESDLATRGRAREQRLALGLLLSRAGVELAPGEELRGLNRRRATGGLSDLAARAFATRELSCPSDRQLEHAARDGARLYSRVRRWELPRTMLGRVIEVWVARDRAGYLAARGYSTDVRRVFDEHASPRDVAVVARTATG